MRRVQAALVLASLAFASAAGADVPASPAEGGSPAPAGARSSQDERIECAQAYEQAQRLRQSGEVKKAFEAATRCAQPTCPSLLADECKPWSAQLRQQLSRLDVVVVGSDACPANDAVVEIDRVAQSNAFEHLVEPGVHEVRAIESGSKRIVDKTINLARGERRTVELGFAAPGAACRGAATSGRAHATRIPKVALGLGIAGGVLLLTGVTLGAIGAVKRGDLDECRPRCSADQIDRPRGFFVAGDVIGAFGLLTLGAATAVFFLVRGDADAPPRAAASAGPRGLELRF